MPLNAKKRTRQKMSSIATEGSNDSNHVWLNDHQIDFDNTKVIDKVDYRVRKTLESRRTTMNEADYNSRPLPRQYNILLN